MKCSKCGKESCTCYPMKCPECGKRPCTCSSKREVIFAMLFPERIDLRNKKSKLQTLDQMSHTSFKNSERIEFIVDNEAWGTPKVSEDDRHVFRHMESFKNWLNHNYMLMLEGGTRSKINSENILSIDYKEDENRLYIYTKKSNNPPLDLAMEMFGPYVSMNLAAIAFGRYVLYSIKNSNKYEYGCRIHKKDSYFYFTTPYKGYVSRVDHKLPSQLPPYPKVVAYAHTHPKIFKTHDFKVQILQKFFKKNPNIKENDEIPNDVFKLAPKYNFVYSTFSGAKGIGWGDIDFAVKNKIILFLSYLDKDNNVITKKCNEIGDEYTCFY